MPSTVLVASVASYSGSMRNQRSKISLKTILAGGLTTAMLLGIPAAAQPAQAEPADAPAQIDRQERQPTVRTYEKFPDPQGNDQDLAVPTYNKKPDPSGKNQSLEFVRYDEKNKDNNGENPVQLTILEEGEV